MIELILFLLLSLLIVFISALLFVNSIEFLASEYNVGGSFVGAIVSPLFTSLPELIVLLVAIFSLGGAAGAAIGIGTVFGQPFMASSLSYGLVGIVVLIGVSYKKRKHKFLQVSKTLAIPFTIVTILFPLTIVPSLVAVNYVRYIFGIIFFLSYVGYVALMYKRRTFELIENAEDPYFCKIFPHKIFGSLIQLAASVIILYFGADQLVMLVSQIATGLSISPMGLAIIAVPAATAIPETASALIWGFRGKDTLSIASLVGEKVLFSTLFPGFGLLLTAWVLDIHAYLSVLVTLVVSLLMLFFISRRRIPWYGLTIGLFFFVAYAVAVFLLRV